jgi:hypothetical protein
VDEAKPRRRHSAELYDAIWELEVPHVDTVKRSVVRLVLMAMAKHTNPNRDGGRFLCWASVKTIAALADVEERQVQRVLKQFSELRYIEAEKPGVRGGRGGRQPRATTWLLCPERWPRRPGSQIRSESPVNVNGVADTDNSELDTEELGRGSVHVDGSNEKLPTSAASTTNGSVGVDGSNPIETSVGTLDGAMEASVATPEPVREEHIKPVEPVESDSKVMKMLRKPAVSPVWCIKCGASLERASEEERRQRHHSGCELDDFDLWIDDLWRRATAPSDRPSRSRAPIPGLSR